MERVEPGDVPGEDLEKLFDALRHLTEALESGSLTLEQSLDTYEEAKALERRIRRVLDEADAQVMILDKEGRNQPFGYTDE